VPSQFLRHPEPEDRFFDGVVKYVQADQAGMKITVGITGLRCFRDAGFSRLGHIRLCAEERYRRVWFGSPAAMQGSIMQASMGLRHASLDAFRARHPSACISPCMGACSAFAFTAPFYFLDGNEGRLFSGWLTRSRTSALRHARLDGLLGVHP